MEDCAFGKIESLQDEIQRNVGVRDDLVSDLCQTLIDLAKQQGDWQSVAFGYVWYADHHFYVSNDMQSVLTFLDLAEKYIDTQIPSKLLEKFYTLKHLLCDSSFELYAAFRFTLYALDVSKQLGLHGRVGANYGNVGSYFLECGCYEEALVYSKLALDTLGALPEVPARPLRILLSNLVLIHLRLDDAPSALETLERLEALPLQPEDLNIYVHYGYLLYYAHLGQQELCLTNLQAMLDDGLMDFPNHAFIVEFMVNALEAMMRVSIQDRARTLLDALCHLTREDDPRPQLTVHGLKVDYSRQFGSVADLSADYRTYYSLYWQARKTINDLKAEGLRAKVALHETSLRYAQSREELDALHALVNLDDLTGVYSRRYLNVRQEELLTGAGEGIHMGFAIFDVDYFKEYNDHYGHMAGDHVLAQVGACLRDSAVEGISAFRYGGDEFVALCAGVDQQRLGAYVAAVAAALAERDLPHLHSPCAPRVTLSVGYGVGYVTARADAFALFEQVDGALYEAKREGRNRATEITALSGMEGAL